MAEEKESRAKTGLGGEKKKKKSPEKKKSGGSKKHVHEMHIRRAANGGYISKLDREREAGEMGPEHPEEHQLADLDQLHDHVDEHMGEPEEQQPPQMAQAGPGPDPSPEPGAAQQQGMA